MRAIGAAILEGPVLVDPATGSFLGLDIGERFCDACGRIVDSREPCPHCGPLCAEEEGLTFCFDRRHYVELAGHAHCHCADVIEDGPEL